jgi:hypothetical protein
MVPVVFWSVSCKLIKNSFEDNTSRREERKKEGKT